MSFFGSQLNKPATTLVTDTDVELQNGPTDTASCLAWSPTADLLAISSWDNQVRIYQVDGQGQSQGKAAYSHEGPVLSVCWSKDGSKIISGGADKAARLFDAATQQSSQVAAHDAPIRAVKWIDASNGLLCTGSWDKTIKYWDLRTSAPVLSVTLPERVYTMDVTFPWLVVGCANRNIEIYNLNNPGTLFRHIESPLKWQTRSIACFPDGQGFAVGSIEGRLAIQYIDEKQSSLNFSFRCHRKEQATNKNVSDIWAVNAVSFNQQHGTFSTAGADGTICYWDHLSKTRLKIFDNRGGPITSTAFSAQGTYFAYNVAYDWSKGHSGALPSNVNKTMLHLVKDEEVRKKPKNKAAHALMSYFGGGANLNKAVVNDVELTSPPNDSVTALSWCPTQDLLAVSAWDNQVRIYQVTEQGQSQGKAAYSHDGPALDVCWSKDGTRVLSAGADKAARLFDVATQQSSQVAAHDAPVRCVRWIDGHNLLATGSWDKTIKYWDLRQPTAALSVTLPERVYAMDVASQLMVVGCANRNIEIYNLTNPGTLFQHVDSPLKWQTRSVACFPDATGYALGSIEGRIAIQYITEKDAASSFSFKAHRKENPTNKSVSDVHSINSISFHPVHGTFATSGGDATIVWWDYISKARLKAFDPQPAPVLATAYSSTGRWFSWACGYDWHKGHEGNMPTAPNKIFLHPIKDEEARRRPKK
ncbi:uncharacterized protein L969DRAFT_101656 [Mixia osmundae IAM 14324]|uniref:Anaphase-promoting complex subunit 4-like WD40 domain-containing protein n=1 Tax=Mixia osmundae (strain CBS 9802 / IAM 14324 / JCM 22182 / KY 12970) TaxID=764103 RepID=G7DY93_MIXOS|nr:uncharacterized protein L969DRAFT_101656 [Mixia osmundae IAM 14324]KEI41456.1 hypothetical protein L969DRAFT_101656 [Mixia osmundae IAM 14324]GAA95553.1 hypothetical protein E5Q_02208 [Mixia osmundae IAM 14324]